MSRAIRLDRKGKLIVPESSLEAAIFDILSLDDWRVFRFGWAITEAGRQLSEVGAPDLLAIRYRDYMLAPAAEVLWIEVKTAGRKPDAGQKLWHVSERRRGALVWIAGDTFPATVEGFLAHYRGSGLQLRQS